MSRNSILINRAKEKQLSREADLDALASGEKTKQQLREENHIFAGRKFIINFSNESNHNMSYRSDLKNKKRAEERLAFEEKINNRLMENKLEMDKKTEDLRAQVKEIDDYMLAVVERILPQYAKSLFIHDNCDIFKQLVKKFPHFRFTLTGLQGCYKCNLAPVWVAGKEDEDYYNLYSRFEVLKRLDVDTYYESYGHIEIYLEALLDAAKIEEQKSMPQFYSPGFCGHHYR